MLADQREIEIVETKEILSEMIDKPIKVSLVNGMVVSGVVEAVLGIAEIRSINTLHYIPISQICDMAIEEEEVEGA